MPALVSKLARGYALVMLCDAVLRHLLPGTWSEVLCWAPRCTAEAAAFARFPALMLVLALATVFAMWLGAGAVLRTGQGQPPGRGFSASVLLMAISGVTLALLRGETMPGGTTIVFYTVGHAALMVLALLIALRAARRGQALVMRDWTLYCWASALVPVTVLLTAPLWALMPQMDALNAMATAVTLSFAGHYFLAHLWIVEGLDRRRPRVPRNATDPSRH